MIIKKKLENKILDTNLVEEEKKSKYDGGIMSIFPFSLFRSNKPVVAILRLDGIVGKVRFKSGLTLQAMNKLIEEAFKISRLEAICLAVNSPGGSPVQSELIAKRIIDLSKEKNIPVYSFIEDVAASGGYWLACAGEQIFASKSSIVGSIGVISSSFGFHKAIEKLGIDRRIHTQGKNKSVLDPFVPEKAEDKKIIARIQKDIHEHFKDYIKSRRGGRLTQNDDFLFNGEFWTGEKALDYGLVDGISSLHEFIKKTFGDNIKIQNIETKQSWIKKKFSLRVNIDANNAVNSAIDSLESRALYDRFEL